MPSFLSGQLALLFTLRVCVKHGQGLGLVLFLLVECCAVGGTLAFMTHGEFFKLRFNVGLINQLNKGRSSVQCMEAVHCFPGENIQLENYVFHSSGVAVTGIGSAQLQLPPRREVGQFPCEWYLGMASALLMVNHYFLAILYFLLIIFTCEDFSYPFSWI